MEISVAPSTTNHKRLQDDPLEAAGPPVKVSRLSQEDDEADFSTPVRKKLSASARTGQACDRCKVRKIKCDGNPDGCVPCQQAQHTCKTTDRNNGRTTVRGHSDKLEWENRYLKEQIAAYQKQLQDLQSNAEATARSSQLGFSHRPTSSQSSLATSQNAKAYVKSNNELSAKSDSRSHARGKTGAERNLKARHISIDDIYHAPAVDLTGKYQSSSYNSCLSLLNGTTLSLFGMDIDVAKFSNASSNMTVDTSPQTFFKYAYGKVSAEAPKLPATLEEARTYAWWYFRSLNAYTPFLHKPDFFSLLSRIYDNRQTAPLTVAEDVMVHMLLGEMKYQHGQRNNAPTFLEEGLAHYRYSLTRLPELLSSRKLPDVQALLLICFRTRGFPRSGAAWLCCQMTLTMAIELNLHRAAEHLPKDQQAQLTEHDKEMRKRIFWTIYALAVVLSGKQGRPPSINHRDIDIEMPEALPDMLPEESGSGDPEIRENVKSCSYRVGVEILKLYVLQGQMYANLLGIQRNNHIYAREVARLEQELRNWRNNLPAELTDPTKVSGEWQVFALYLEFYTQEFQFLLRHPVIHSATNPELFDENAKIIVEVCDKMRKTVVQINECKALDVVWMNVTIFLAAIFTVLFMHDQPKQHVTAQELVKLEADMTEWMNLLEDVGQILGTGSQLAESTRKVIDNALVNIRKNAGIIPVESAPVHHMTNTVNVTPSLPLSSGANAYNARSFSQHVKSEPSIAAPIVRRKAESTYNDQTHGPATNAYATPTNGQVYNYPQDVSTQRSTFPSEPTTYTASAVFTQAPIPHIPAHAMGQTFENVANSNYYAPQQTAQQIPPITGPAADWLKWSATNLVSYTQPDSVGFMHGSTSILAMDNSGVSTGGSAATNEGGSGLQGHRLTPQTPTSQGLMEADNTAWPLTVFSLGQGGTAGGQ